MNIDIGFNSSKSSFQHLLYYHHHRSLSNFIYLLLLEIKPRPTNQDYDKLSRNLFWS